LNIDEGILTETSETHTSTEISISFKESLYEGLRQGLYSFYTLFKIMTPVYILISILKEIAVLEILAGYFSPFMKFLGLPGETALAVVLGWTVNLYAAIAAFAGLGLSIRQVTILAVMLGISHSHFMETAIISRMKARPWLILLIRIVTSLFIGALMNLILPENF